MGYTIFEGTLADMTFVEVEEAARAGAIALFPIGVLEEHGPHMCLGTDIYLAYKCCKRIKEELEKKKIQTIIIPPFYWGINHSTGAFTGSFSSSKETMKNGLLEIMTHMQKWGFNSIFPVSVHLDFVHTNVILDAVKDALKLYNVGSYMVFPNDVLSYYGLTGKEDYIIALNSEPAEVNLEECIDVHAGSIETSWMTLQYPDLVKKEIAKTLPPSEITYNDMDTWYKGGEEVKQMIPKGYIGDPAKTDMEKAICFENSIVDDYVKAISDFMADNYAIKRDDVIG